MRRFHEPRTNGGFLTRFKSLLEINRLGELLLLQGLISREQLQRALACQQLAPAPLGRVLVAQKIISRRALYSTLGQQWTLRCLAGLLSFIIAVSGVGISRAHAGALRDTTVEISLSPEAGDAFAPVSAYPALFGAEEKSSSDIGPFTKWADMFERFDDEIHTADGHKSVTRLQDKLRPLQGLPLEAMAQKVNDIANAMPYINDSTNWGVSDYWASPVQFFARGGDCEDFAIAKYAALRALGVPEGRLRITILQDLKKNIPHAVLTLYTDDDVLILDNQIKTVTPASRIGHYKPIFSINRTAWWLHSLPGRDMVASR